MENSNIRSPSMGCWTCLFLVMMLTYQFSKAFYNLYFSPLAKFPGPLLAKVTPWPSFYHALRRDRHIWIRENFLQYGNRIRISPNTVLFNDPTAYRDVYSHKANTYKDRFYNIWSQNEQDVSIFNTTDIAPHSRKRKVFNTMFTDTFIRSTSPFIVKVIDRWNELLVDKDQEWSNPIELAPRLDSLAFDILGELCFGQSFDTIEPRDTAYQMIPEAIISFMKFWHPISKSPMLGAILWLKPRGLDQVLKWLTPTEILNYGAFVEQKVTERLDRESERQGPDNASRKDMLHYLINAKDPETKQPVCLTKEELVAEANILVIAGSHTTATALTGFFYYITHYPRVYAKLTSLIRSTFSSNSEVVEGRKLSSCYYLRACIDEAIRLAPVGPEEFPRVVLPGGQVIDGAFVPEGTTVGFSNWASGHNEATYEAWDEYRPERWIVDEETGVTADEVARIKNAFHPFTAGPGNCVGQNLAMLEMMLVAARTLWRMDVRLYSNEGREVGVKNECRGGGDHKINLGDRERPVMQYKDAYIALMEGPTVQFRLRQAD